MKKYILTTLILTWISISIHARNGFSTTFNISDMPDSTEFVIRIHDGIRGFQDFRYDTIQIVNGHGVLTDVSKVNYPVRAYVYTPNGIFDIMVGNNTSEIISGSSNDIEEVSLDFEGAPWSEDMILYNKHINAPLTQLNKAQENFPQLSQEERDSIYAGYKSIQSKEQLMYRQYPNSWITLDRLTSDMTSMPRKDLQEIYDQLTEDRKVSLYGKTIGRYLSVTPIAEGDSMAEYDIEGTDQFGNSFKLTDMTEPYVMVDFSQYYCGPCIKATKEISELIKKYEGHVGFVNYCCDVMEDLWHKAIKRDNITWPSVFDGTGPRGNTCMKYNVDGYPTFFIFGPDRTLIKTWSGYGDGVIHENLLEVFKIVSGTEEN